MRADSDQRSPSTVGRAAECGAETGGPTPAQARLEQAVGHELAQRLVAALSGPHGHDALHKP